MTLEQRVRRIELKLNQGPQNVSQPESVNLLDLPREMVVGAFAIHKELFGGYHFILDPNPIENGIERYATINQLTPEEFYDLMVRNVSKKLEAKG